MLFFLLLASDFHQGPELPVSPLSAMPAGRGPAVPPVGKGLGGSGRPLPVASGFHSAGSPASRKRVAGREPRPVPGKKAMLGYRGYHSHVPPILSPPFRPAPPWGGRGLKARRRQPSEVTDATPKAPASEWPPGRRRRVPRRSRRPHAPALPGRRGRGGGQSARGTRGEEGGCSWAS